MNKSMVLLCGGLVFSGSAIAQSSVTLYGIADASIRYLSHANTNNSAKLSLENGAITNSRFGIRGIEDIGGGLKTVFNLLGNFSPTNGALSNGLLFSRTAFVGLQSGGGTLTFGRQQTALFDLLVFSFDPLTVGNYSGNEWVPVALSNGGRADNMVKYAGKFGGLSVTTGYSFGADSTKVGPNGFSGEIPGGFGKGSQYSLAVSYTAGEAAFGAAFQQTRDNSNNRMTVYNVDATYMIGAAKVFLGYLHSTDNTGFVDNVLYALGGRVTPFSPAKGSNRKDDAFFSGVTWQVGTRVKLTAAGYYDRSQNAATSSGGTAFGGGKRYTIVGLAEYALSKQSHVYSTVDYSHASGAATFVFPGASNQTEIGVGMRHTF